MFHIVLYQPEIPPNTGNIIRLCANTGSSLHLIKPLGFELEDRKLKRAGLDYHEWARVRDYSSLPEFLEQTSIDNLYAFSTKGTRAYHEVGFMPQDAFLFGPETRGLPCSLLESMPIENRLVVPMLPNSRSLNLSNTVAVVVFEAWRQLHFAGAARRDCE